jgi:uncharacterized repeat protein (TIGR01451 family)
MKTLLSINIIFLFLISYFLFPLSQKVSAQSPTCTPIFGGGDTCEKHPDLSIDKHIQDPQTKKYLDSLTLISNFLPDNQTLTFRITVKNTSNKDISNIMVSDALPAIYTYKSSNGAFDMKARTFNDSIKKLSKGQSKIYTINVTLNQAALARSTACTINFATIKQNNKNGSDYVKTCINISKEDVKSGSTQITKGGLKSGTSSTTKGGLPIFAQKSQTKTPDTGPEMLGILGLPVLAIAGHFLRRKTA